MMQNQINRTYGGREGKKTIFIAHRKCYALTRNNIT